MRTLSEAQHLHEQVSPTNQSADWKQTLLSQSKTKLSQEASSGLRSLTLLWVSRLIAYLETLDMCLHYHMSQFLKIKLSANLSDSVQRNPNRDFDAKKGVGWNCFLKMKKQVWNYVAGRGRKSFRCVWERTFARLQVEINGDFKGPSGDTSDGNEEWKKAVLPDHKVAKNLDKLCCSGF